MVIFSSRYTFCTVFIKSTPSLKGFWNAFRPIIKPDPPAHLLITAVIIASTKSDSPLDPPPELINPIFPYSNTLLAIYKGQ